MPAPYYNGWFGHATMDVPGRCKIILPSLFPCVRYPQSYDANPSH